MTNKHKTDWTWTHFCKPSVLIGPFSLISMLFINESADIIVVSVQENHATNTFLVLEMTKTLNVFSVINLLWVNVLPVYVLWRLSGGIPVPADPEEGKPPEGKTMGVPSPGDDWFCFSMSSSVLTLFVESNLGMEWVWDICKQLHDLCYSYFYFTV